MGGDSTTGSSTSNNGICTLEDLYGAVFAGMGGMDINHPKDGHHHDHHHDDSHGHHHAPYAFAGHFEVAVEWINTAAGLIILLSVASLAMNMVIIIINANLGTKLSMFNPLQYSAGKAPPKPQVATVTRARMVLGEHTALALGLLVAADVLDTVLKPAHAFAFADVGKMFAVMALRTVLAYFLALELKELEHEDQHQSHAHDEHHDHGHGQGSSGSHDHDHGHDHDNNDKKAIKHDDGHDHHEQTEKESGPAAAIRKKQK